MHACSHAHAQKKAKYEFNDLEMSKFLEGKRFKRLWLLSALMTFIVVCALVFLLSYYLVNEKCSPTEINVCLHLSDYNNETISFLIDLGVSWVRTDWIKTSDNSMRDYSQNLQDNNISLLAIIDANTFNNENFTLTEWNKTIIEIVTSEGFNNTDAVEIWNEPNAQAYVDPDTYFEMLKSAYVIIKNCTEADIVFSGISPNIENWTGYLNAVFSYNETSNYFDFMGIHLYDDEVTNAETLKFVKNLTTKPIWVTETGKPSIDGDEESQATYLSSLHKSVEPLVSKIFIYELMDNSGLFPEKENHFGLITVNGTKKEAYYRIWEIGRE